MSALAEFDKAPAQSDDEPRSRWRGPNWYLAATLLERLELVRGRAVHSREFAFDPDLARRRLARWRAQTPFGSDAAFARRLAADGISQDEFRLLLGEAVDAGRPGPAPKPAWLATFESAFARRAAGGAPRGAFEADDTRQQLLGVVAPLVRQACLRLRQSLRGLARRCSDRPFRSPAVEGMLIGHLEAQLAGLLGRTLILELNVARVQGRLRGATPEERYRTFFRRLGRRQAALAFFAEYPVLARQVAAAIERWLEASLALLEHLCADWAMLVERFFGGTTPGQLSRIEAGLGDPHRGGRSVVALAFASGARLIYKPHSLAVDAHFQDLIAWLNERGARPPLRTLEVLDRGDHGWVEFVEPVECTSADEVRRFYLRQGAYLAILYALGATDFHYENLIASGEHPVLLDLEALFHSRVGLAASPVAVDQVGLAMAESVLDVGLLPEWRSSTPRGAGVDVSGLGAPSGQPVPGGVPALEAAGTDEARLVARPGTLPSAHHRPSLGGREASVLDHVDDVVAGFVDTYRLLVGLRDDLLAVDGPLARFSTDSVRVIARQTQIYALLLNAASHPDVLRNALDRERLFDRLWIETESRPRLADLNRFERHDLEMGDIPVFTTCPSSRDVWTSSGERLPDFLDESGLAHARRRLEGLDEKDLERQLWFIRASLATLAVGAEHAHEATHATPGRAEPADREELLAAARSIGDRLAALAIAGDDGGAAWIGVTATDREHWALAPLWLDLYDGLPGVAFFLAYLGAATGEPRYTRLAEAALTSVDQLLERGAHLVEDVGAFDGWGGLIYTFTHLGSLWRRADLMERAEAFVERLPNLVDGDRHLDLIKGSAGCVASLLAFDAVARSDRARAIARRCGDLLVERAHPMARGVGWLTESAPARPLAGFSHGAAGIAWALLRLAERTGESRYRETARAAITYERSLYVRDVGNWPDLRDVQAPDGDLRGMELPFMVAWCHGAPGIGLARLLALPLLDDARVLAEVEAALRTTVEHPHGDSHSLCHGDLGNLELPLQAGDLLGEPAWRRRAAEIAGTVLESARRHGWRCGTPLGVESPGLMTGLAGIGYGLLRLAAPERVPSVLSLEPPRGDV